MAKHKNRHLELTPDNYINRELSWIEFNQRVLHEAQDESVPLLERIKFLAIFSSNLDEFFMVRVAYHHQKAQGGSTRSRPDGYAPIPLLEEMRRRITIQVKAQYDTLTHVLARLAQHNIHLKTVHELETPARDALRTYFAEAVYPVLTPLAVDHARPFPFISNLSLNLAVVLRRYGSGENEFVRLKVPEMLPRLVNVGQIMMKYGESAPELLETFVWLEDVIAENLDMLFPGMDVIEQYPFRVTRNADIDYEHEKEDTVNLDVSEWIEETVRERRFGDVVRLNVPEGISRVMLTRLVDELEISERDVHPVPGALGLTALFQLTNLDHPELKYPVYTPRMPAGTDAGKNLFTAIRENDILVHLPYDSFAPVEEFFRVAARDPDVLAIKATLYRVGRNSPIVQALMEARDNDKQVAVLVELKARFDEQNNLEWARALENKGVHVTYGVEELPVKTHAKIALVVRREADGVRRYVHLSTGNYNSGTARQYTDIGLFTCNNDIADDATRLFNRLTGFAPGTSYKRLLVAPEYLLNGFLELIEGEIQAARAGKFARIAAKMNQLEEDEIIKKLYEASQAGVQIDLCVRGLCCLRPGVPGLSENIRVRSIVGRYLEHSRIFYFHNAPEERQMLMGSADLMRRNLYNRVEVTFPVLDAGVRRLVLRTLETSLHDNQKAWELLPDGSYACIVPAPGEALIDSQQTFMRDSYGLEIPI
ncbi:MAG: polyphosphate kinase 1 [Chloroflexi bacterium]|nr:polyphosphate kinase 1 [Chloroflexota bacterium]